MQWLEQTVTAGVILILLLGTGIYVANTALYLTPVNPLKAQWLPVIRAVQHPLFAQNWHLFAPNPIRTDFVLTVRCRTAAGTSPWADITAPLLVRHQFTRSSPAGRVLRVQQNALRVWMGRTGDEEWRAAICRVQPGNPVCRAEDQVARRMRENGALVLARVASAACDRLVGRRSALRAQLALLVHTPPPFSRRLEPSAAGTTRYLLLPWMDYQRVGR